jgi:hypothetical protein
MVSSLARAVTTQLEHRQFFRSSTTPRGIVHALRCAYLALSLLGEPAKSVPAAARHG